MPHDEDDEVKTDGQHEALTRQLGQERLKLDRLEAAHVLHDLAALPGNREHIMASRAIHPANTWLRNLTRCGVPAGNHDSEGRRGFE